VEEELAGLRAEESAIVQEIARLEQALKTSGEKLAQQPTEEQIDQKVLEAENKAVEAKKKLEELKEKEERDRKVLYNSLLSSRDRFSE
jgi:tellurite resistance protein